MPSKPIPSCILDLRGAYKKDPQRRRPFEPKPKKGIGDCPSFLSQSEQTCWHELKAQCCPGVLTSADAVVLEIGARILAEFRADFRAVPVRKLAQFLKILGVLGLTPADRARIKVEPEEVTNKFAAIG